MREEKEQAKETTENTEKVEETKVEEKKKGWTINKVTIWRILAYFALYSFLGFVIETAYGFLTQGKLESRQSFLYGPFCGIYGVGAVIMIVALHRLDRSRVCYRILYEFNWRNSIPCKMVGLFWYVLEHWRSYLPVIFHFLGYFRDLSCRTS